MAAPDTPEDQLKTVAVGPSTGGAPPVTPAKIGKYPILRPLGKGGMGMVYLAQHPELEVPVAVKVLSAELGRHDPQFGERFLSEARLMAKVSHANIVRIFDVGEDGDIRFLIMEYMAGGSARDLLARSGPLPIDRVLDIGIAVAQGLTAADRHGIVHRDIKPDNILLDEAGEAKLADLGMAKSLENARDSSLTSTGIAMGTPHYMAPEQARSAKHADRRADIYALGATLYHLLTGRPPFEDETAVGVLLKHCNEPLPDPRKLRPDVPEAVARIVQKAMAKDPDARYQDGASLAADLRAARGRTALPRTPSGYRRWLMAAATLVVLALLLIWWRSGQGPAANGAAAVAGIVPGELLIDADFNRPGLDDWTRIEAAEGWDWNPLETVDANRSQPGRLTLVPATSAWYNDYRGPFLYQLVEGDFVATAHVTIAGRHGDLPSADYSVAGLMLRAPRAGTGANQENVLWLAMGTTSPSDQSLSFELKNTRRSTSETRFLPIPGNTAELRLVRLGNAFLMMTRLPDGPWQLQGRYDRDEFGPDVQIGLAAGTDWSSCDAVGPQQYNREGAAGNPDLRASVDFVRVCRLDARNGLTPTELLAADNARLTALFGEAFDP